MIDDEGKRSGKKKEEKKERGRRGRGREAGEEADWEGEYYVGVLATCRKSGQAFRGKGGGVMPRAHTRTQRERPSFLLGGQ